MIQYGYCSRIIFKKDSQIETEPSTNFFTDMHHSAVGESVVKLVSLFALIVTDD